MGVIELAAIDKFFGQIHVVKNVNLTIEAGEFVVFVGPSGCGKSTMMRLIAGLEDVSAGSIKIDGQDVTGVGAAERGLAMVFQSYALYPHMTVRENMGFGLKISNADRNTVDQAVQRAANVLQLSPLLDRRPKELSGGQRQRVAIGRAIVRDPTAFLFDEPLSNLDAALRVQMRIEIAQLHKRLAKTMIYVTHDQVEAMTLADRIVVFNGGVIQQQGVPMELYHRPANLFVATFIGSPKMNVLSCSSSKKGIVLANGVAVAQPEQDRQDVAYWGIRPEHVNVVEPSSSEADVVGMLVLAEHLGGDSYLYIDVEGLETINVRVAGGSVLCEDQQVGLSFPRERMHLFDSDGFRLDDS